MDPEIKKILDKQTALLEENTGLVRKIRRAQVAGTVTWVLKWLLVLGLAFGFYVRFQPTILRLFEAYDKLLLDIKGVPEVLESIRSGE